MRFFLDTEFIEDGRTIDLISIGVVAENGQEFYRQNAQADLRKANAWVQGNVIPRLWECPKKITGTRHMYGLCADPTCVWRPKRAIRDELYGWVRDQTGLNKEPWNPEFWGYYADYDWVVLCQLFGAMVDLPKGWPMYCRDLKQWADDLGADLSGVAQDKEHNALSDARWNHDVHLFLGGLAHARQRDQQEIPTRQVDQESGHVRSLEAGGQGQVDGSGDQQRGVQQVRQTRHAPYEEAIGVAGDPAEN